MSKSTSRVDDLMWKAILEDVFADFLRFFFPDEVGDFDLETGFDYLDKEFETLFPPEPNNKGVRFVDKLIKVFLTDGSSKFILVHVEVQSHKGKGDLAKRMFNYFYKILDKYNVPITAIAILLDSNKKHHPSVYVQEFMGTRITYEFNSYKVMDQDEALLRADPNPFAVVVLTALLDIKNKKTSDEKLLSIKHDLYDEMMKREMDKKTRQGIYDFLKHYVSFQDDEKFTIFDREIKEKLGRSDTMGMQEYLLEKAKTKGLKLGRIEERARAEAERLAEKLESARKFKAMGMAIEDIAKGLGLSIEEVEKI